MGRGEFRILVAESTWFNFSRKLHIVFHHGWTNLHSPKQYIRVSFFYTSLLAYCVLSM